MRAISWRPGAEVASAGIALLVAAGLLPWAFLREPFDLSLEASKIALLTPEAQSVISSRQHQVALLISVIPWISVALALMGVFLTGYGLLKWRARQAIRDQGEDADVQTKLKDMSREQVEQKARDDAVSLEEEPTQALTAQPPTSTDHNSLAPWVGRSRPITEFIGSDNRKDAR